MKRILYVRSGPYQINLNTYNSQEIGLSYAFVDKDICCDIVYYHKLKNFNQEIKKNGHTINILWRKGIRLLRSGIYPQILKKEFLDQYDAVIVSEYSQIMSVLLSRLHNNVYIYNGPYYNLFKLPFWESIYDVLFCKMLNQNTKKVFCKTQMAREYLQKKGFTNCEVVGVGLDTTKFDDEIAVETATTELLEEMYGHRNLFYVGSISRRKNVGLLIEAFNLIKKNDKNGDVQFIIVGKDEEGYLKECQKLIEKQAKDSIIFKPFIKNAQLKFVYEKVDIFMLPSKQEIFGMVLLEAMYFGVPALASGSAGAKTLIDDGINGRIVMEFDVRQWADAIQKLLSSKEDRFRIGQSAATKIKTQFMWSNIVAKMLRGMEL